MTDGAVDMRWAVDPRAAARMGTAELRQNFLIERLFVPGEVKLVYTHYDRMVLGGAVPSKAAPLDLKPVKTMGTTSFLERRELMIINVGTADGVVHADGTTHTLKTKEMLYLGMGTGDVRVEATGDTSPRFYLLSAPAHYRYDSVLLTLTDTNKLEFGATETSNKRTIHQFAHANSPLKTCQLVAGITIFAAGSVWNTMPPHLHDRRMEAYLYFDLDETARVFHMMGEPGETRHIVVANEQAVVSPAWSIHSGVGTASYTFVWAMAGDNVDYTDVDAVPVTSLK